MEQVRQSSYETPTPKGWGLGRKVVSEDGAERRCLAVRLRLSWLTVFHPLGWKGLGPRYKQSQNQKHSARELPFLIVRRQPLVSEVAGELPLEESGNPHVRAERGPGNS